jgi:hypothetical protein
LAWPARGSGCVPEPVGACTVSALRPRLGLSRMWHLHIARDVWRQPLCIRWALFCSPD